MAKLTEDDMRPRARLLALARERRVSMAELSDLIGRNPSYLQQYVGRGSPRRLDEADRHTLARFFGVDDRELGGPAASADVAMARHGDLVAVPRLPLSASAGPGSFGAEEIPFDSFYFSPRWLKEHGFDAARLSAIRVEGDSMEPLLRDGDEILVERLVEPPRDGVHVVRLGELLHVKRLQQMEAGRFQLVSANPAYAPIEITHRELDVIGRVVWKGGRL